MQSSPQIQVCSPNGIGGMAPRAPSERRAQPYSAAETPRTAPRSAPVRFGIWDAEHPENQICSRCM